MALSFANSATQCFEPARSTWRGLISGVALALFVLATIAPADAQAGNRGRSARAAKSAIHKGDRKTASASSRRAGLAARFLPLPARGRDSGDDAFISARRYFANSDKLRFEQSAAAVGDHPLADYLVYWRLSMALRSNSAGDGTDVAVDKFLQNSRNALLADNLRRDYLLSLGRRERWEQLRAQSALWLGRDDMPAQCYVWIAEVIQTGELAAAARDYLMQPRELGDGCNPLLVRAYGQGLLTKADLRKRLRLSIEVAAFATGRRVASMLELDSGELELAFREPMRTLNRANASSDATLAAIAGLARKDPQDAANVLRNLVKLDAATQSVAWALVAAQGAQRLLPEAVSWTRAAFAGDGKNPQVPIVSDETMAWLVRTALANSDWPLVSRTILAMSDTGQREPVWVYWQARALRAAGLATHATHLLQSIAGQSSFYGYLAAEESVNPVPLPLSAAPVTVAEASAAQTNPGFARALKLYTLGLRADGNREWNFQLRAMSDRELLAAADYACKSEVLDRCVNTADRTRNEHNFSLRYLAPFRDRLTIHAQAQNLDPAFVYGLIRQESRFAASARSHVGAQGLMQIMPATANWIARQLGQIGFQIGHLHDLETNLRFGTYYLRDVARRFEDSQVLASAAYNAGPGRPARWRQALSKVVDGALFAEIIPFDETRDYVKKVMWNATWYAAVFSGKPQSLRQRLGMIAPTPISEAQRAIEMQRATDVQQATDPKRTTDAQRSTDAQRAIDAQRTVDAQRTIEVPRAIDVPDATPPPDLTPAPGISAGVDDNGEAPAELADIERAPSELDREQMSAFR